jgi:hypothetical protein
MFVRLFIPLLALLLSGRLASAAIINVSTSAALQTAINTAVPGDEIVLANGTYATTGTGFTWFSATNGTATQPITIRALNRHQAIIQGDNTCGGSHLGFYMYKQYWIVKDLKFTQMGRAIVIYQSNIEIRNNIIADFKEEGIRVHGSDFPPIQNVYIHHNVVANGESCTGADSPGIYLVQNASNNTVAQNIIMATGNNGYQCAGVGGCSGTGDKFGYGMLIAVNSDANVIQGNLFVANQGKGVFRILSDEFNSTHADNNLVRDNAFLFGEGGGDGSNDCTEDANQFINNIHYGNYFHNWSAKGNINSLKGHHLLQHNLFYATAFSRSNVEFALNTCGGQPIGYKIANIIKDNIFYADGALTGVQDTRVHLGLQGPYASIIAASTNNLFWAPSAPSTWVFNYTYDPTDIHAAGAPPVFLNEVIGDFSLASGSAGVAAASDCTDMGVSYNGFLKKSWLRRAFQLPTQLADPVTTSASFTVNPTRYYQIWFYVPNTPFTGLETFVVEGDSRQRDIATLHADTTWTQPGGPARWITLGRARATDGILNITWTNASSANKIFIRELPTPDEAYQWILAGSGRFFHLLPP